MKPIDTMWKSYLERVMPEGVGKVQILETKRAFYAGASAIMSLQVTSLDAGSDDESGDMFFKLMDELSDELEAYSRLVISGKA